MIKLIAAALCLSAAASAQEAVAILAKARTAFIENRQRERFWNWTTISTRSITDKEDVVLEKLPSVTIESPIRSDGKRCNAVLAWGDGVEPYLASASADTPLKNVTGGSTKGTFIRYDYELQKDKGGDRTKDFWICVRRYSIRPLQKGAQALIISGRRFPLESSGDRRVALETRTSASELSAESQIKFETEKDK